MAGWLKFLLKWCHTLTRMLICGYGNVITFGDEKLQQCLCIFDFGKSIKYFWLYYE